MIVGCGFLNSVLGCDKWWRGTRGATGNPEGALYMYGNKRARLPVLICYFFACQASFMLRGHVAHGARQTTHPREEARRFRLLMSGLDKRGNPLESRTATVRKKSKKTKSEQMYIGYTEFIVHFGPCWRPDRARKCDA